MEGITLRSLWTDHAGPLVDRVLNTPLDRFGEWVGTAAAQGANAVAAKGVVWFKDMALMGATEVTDLLCRHLFFQGKSPEDGRSAREVWPYLAPPLLTALSTYHYTTQAYRSAKAVPTTSVKDGYVYRKGPKFELDLEEGDLDDLDALPKIQHVEAVPLTQFTYRFYWDVVRAVGSAFLTVFLARGALANIEGFKTPTQ